MSKEDNIPQYVSMVRKEIIKLKERCTKAENKLIKSIENERRLRERLDTIQQALNGSFDHLVN